MKRPVALASVLLGVGAAITAIHLPAKATDNYTYKRGEYPIIRTGRSPDHRFSITTHGEGEGGYDHFHPYLMAEPGHKQIGPLEEIGGDILDTGPNAYQAVWSADSHHVAIFYRSDRHFLAFMLYRIQNRRAYLVTGPTPLSTLWKGHRDEDSTWREGGFKVKWLTPTRFTLWEQDLFLKPTPDFGKRLGQFGKTTREPKDIGDSRIAYEIDFSAQATCELLRGDRYRIITMKPGKFEDM